MPGSKVRGGVLRPAGASRKISLTAAEDPGKTLDGATFISVPAVMVGISPARGMRTQGGLMAASVVPGSPAARAGLKPREIVTVMNRVAIPPQADPRMLNDAIGQLKPGSPVTIEVATIQELDMAVTIGRRPVSRLNLGDLREAREQFAIWWGEQTTEDSIERNDATTSYQPPMILQPPAPEPAVVP